jgi:hypothetical protein
MNWIKENKFLFGFLIVLVIGVGVLSFFVLGAKGHYDDATSSYQSKLGELNRLQKLAIFPNQKNLDKILAQQAEVNTEVNALASALSTQQIPAEDLSPEQFQDRLKASVTNVRNKATQAIPPVTLAMEFFLGFQRYETAPPAREASGAVGRELKAIEWLCNQLIESKVAAIESLERDELPEEAGRVKANQPKPAVPKPVAGKPGKVDKVAKTHEIDKHRIQLTFLTDQTRIRNVLNSIVTYKGQFFLPRLVTVKNEKPEAPKRAALGADPTAPADPATPSASPYIVGEEKVHVTLVLEMVDFTEEPSK